VDTRIEVILAEHGYIAVADHPRLRSTLSRLKLAGELTTPLPGIYLPPEHSNLGWLRAVSAWCGPIGALHGGSAASLWAPEFASPVALVAHPWLASRRGVVVSRRAVPREFVRAREGVRFASPAYAAVELAASDDGRAICEALRLRLTDHDALTHALSAQSGSPGQATRRKVVTSCAGNPWSYAELRLQRILADAGIGDWVANRPIVLGGRELLPDIRFRHRMLIVEFDGRETHDGPSRFLADRERLNVFEAHGYHIVRFGWEHLDQPAYVVAVVRAALRQAAPC
jgi:very-short-patch-repair endonuclease